MIRTIRASRGTQTIAYILKAKPHKYSQMYLIRFMLDCELQDVETPYDVETAIIVIEKETVTSSNVMS